MTDMRLRASQSAIDARQRKAERFSFLLRLADSRRFVQRFRQVPDVEGNDATYAGR